MAIQMASHLNHLIFLCYKLLSATYWRQPFWLSFAEFDSVGEISVPHNKIVDCLTSCIHVAHINDILEKQKSLMHMYTAFLLPEHKWTGILYTSFSFFRCPSIFLLILIKKAIVVCSQNYSLFIYQRTLLKAPECCERLPGKSRTCWCNFFCSGGNGLLSVGLLVTSILEWSKINFILFQIFHSLSPKILHCISTIKIAQVRHCFVWLNIIQGLDSPAL